MDFQRRVAWQMSLHNRHGDEGREDDSAEPDYRCDEVYASDAKFYDCSHFCVEVSLTWSSSYLA